MSILRSKNESTHYKLHVTLENTPFDSLFLHDYTPGSNVLIAGEKTNSFTWEISIPDSVVSTYENMTLLVSFYDHASNSSRMVRFIDERYGENVVIANVGVEDKTSYIKGRYIEESLFAYSTLSTSIANMDLTAIGDLFSEDFKLIIQDDNEDIAVRAIDPFFSWFADFDGKGKSYDDFLASYDEISKQHPDSRFLITSLARNLALYNSPKDVQTIYDNLSTKHKSSKWAEQIDFFLQSLSNKH